VTLRDRNRKTTGNRLSYRSADESYVVSGTPVTVVDECGRETVGRTLTFFQNTDRIIVDGNEQVRTTSKGKSNCS
jgi:lipopolysaccharide export system protein LptA